MKLPAVLLLILFTAGCTGPAATPDLPPSGSQVTDVDRIRVEGYVSARGNMPFSRLVLETDDRNVYLLDLDPAAEAELSPELPGRYRVVGILTLSDWAGRPSASLRPETMERVGG